MTERYTTRTLLSTIQEGLLDIGYRKDLLQENYGFTDMFAQDQAFRSVELGVFAQEPPSYRNACFGVVVPPYQGSEAILNYRALGAPQIFALHPESEEVFCWKILAKGSPQLIDKVEASNLRNVFYSHQAEWNPESILRAKSIRFTNEPIQLDFFDLGLVPELERIVYQKLDSLLNGVIASCESIYKEHHVEGLDYKALFRLIFRLIAAKLLGDRQYPGGWLSTNAQEVIKLVENFYFQHAFHESVLDDTLVQDRAWRQIRGAFSFRNLSVEALAYVYENTFVTPEIRKELGTHATPPEIAEYIVQNLPLEELLNEDGRIFEPFCGHAPFLTAALARLRTLQLDMPIDQRHEYFVRILSGIEIDSFACEIARNSLILADYPNPNGWDITSNNFFALNDLDKHMEQVSVVLCNPPYEDFTRKDRQSNRSIHSANKAVEALHRILLQPPKMLGIVLPRVFMNGQSYRQTKNQISSFYNNITLVELPPIFNFSEAETVLLIAHGKRTTNTKPVWRSVIVEKKDYQQFIQTGRPTTQTEIPSNFMQSESGLLLWHGRLQGIWNELASLPRLGDVAEIHRGVEYKIPLKENEGRLFSEVPRDGFSKGLRRVTNDFEPYVTRSSTYLNMDPLLMLYEAYKLSWDKPKVIANAARISTDRWLIAGSIDEQGLVCTQSYHGIWPTGSIPIEIIAALLNSPITNAFLSAHRTSRHNQIRILKQIPIPELKPSLVHLIKSLVREYISCREQWFHQPGQVKDFESRCRGIIRQIDAILLAAYNLPIKLERELLDYFEGYERPGPINLTGIRPSYAKRFYRSIIKVEDVRIENSIKVVDAIVINWNPDQIVRFPVSLVPRDLQGKLDRDVLLLARINVGATRAEDLLFEDIELASESNSNNGLA